MRKEKVFAAIFLILILGIGASGCKSNMVKDGYTAYKSDEYPITFQYPDDFTLEENKDLEIIVAKNADDTKGMLLVVLNTDIMTLDSLKDQTIESAKMTDENAEISDVAEITIDNLKSYMFDSTITLKELKGDMQYKRRHIITGDDKSVYAFYIQMSPELFDKEQEAYSANCNFNDGRLSIEGNRKNTDPHKKGCLSQNGQAKREN